MKNIQFIRMLFIFVFSLWSLQTLRAQDNPRGPIFEYFQNAAYRIDFGFRNVTSEGVLGDGVRYRKGNSVIYLFDDGRNGIAFEGDLNTPDIQQFFERYEGGINATPEIIALSRTAYAVQNKVLNNDAPDDVKFFDATGNEIPDDGFFNKSRDIFRAEVPIPVISNVFKGIARPGAELNLDAKGQAVNPSIFIGGKTAKLGYANFNWNNVIALPDLSELSDGLTDLRFLYDDLPIIGESGEVIEAFIEFFDRTGAAGGINFATELEDLYNEFANEQGYEAEQRTFGIDVNQNEDASALLEGVTGTVQVDRINAFRELTGILSPKGTSSKPLNKVKSVTKVPGNDKGFSEDFTNSAVNNFKYGGVLVERNDDREWEYNGKVSKTDANLKLRIEGWDESSRARHAEWLTIDYNALDAEANALNTRLFNGEDLPLGLGVSSNPNIRFAPLTIDFMKNYAMENGIEIETLTENIFSIDFVGGRGSGGGSGGSNDDDLPVDRPDGGGFDDDTGGGGNGGRAACLCTRGGCSCDFSNKSYAPGKTFQIPNVLITEEFLYQPNFLSLLMADLGLGNEKQTQKMFLQALTIPNGEQGLLLDQKEVNAAQIELLQRTYMAALAAKQQLLSHLNNSVEDLNTTQVWMQMLQNKDPNAYARILRKLTDFYQTENGIVDGSIFLAPQFNFELSITPTIPVEDHQGKAALALNNTHYNIDIVLTSARLSLGTDMDKDLKADLGVVLDESELQLILDTWAQDLNGDGLIDAGYIVWLQEQLMLAKQHLSERMKSGGNQAYDAYNELLLPLAMADFYKKQVLERPDMETIVPGFQDLIDTGALESEGLMAKETVSYSTHTMVSSEYFFKTDTGDGKNIAFNASQAMIRWNPLTLSGFPISQEEATKNTGTTTKTAAELAPTLEFSNVGFSLKPNTLMLGVGSEGKITLTNTTNGILAPETYVLTTSTTEEALYFDVAKFDVPAIAVGSSVELFFDYTATSADSESNNTEEFRLHRVGAFNTILLRKDYFIEENIMAAIDFSSFCEESQASYATIFNKEVTLAGETVLTGNTVEANGKLTVKATSAIDLTVGFDAAIGAVIDFSITNCDEVQTAIIAGMQNTMTQ